MIHARRRIDYIRIAAVPGGGASDAGAATSRRTQATPPAARTVTITDKTSEGSGLAASTLAAKPAGNPAAYTFLDLHTLAALRRQRTAFSGRVIDQTSCTLAPRSTWEIPGKSEKNAAGL
jgi:hypothetical protein